MNRVAYGAIAAMVGLIVSSLLLGQTHGEQSTETPIKDFGDGVLLLSINRPSGIEARRSSNMFTDAKLVKMGERYFVRGKVWISKHFEQSVWQKGVDGGVAWQDVAEFYIFSEEQMERYIAERKDDQ